MTTPPEITPLREALAGYAHEGAWSSYVLYLLDRLERDAQGRLVLPVAYEAALRRLATTPYAELSQDEQDADRAEADKMLAIVAAVAPMTPAQVEGLAFILSRGLEITFKPDPAGVRVTAGVPTMVGSITGAGATMGDALREMGKSWERAIAWRQAFERHMREFFGSMFGAEPPQ